MKKIAIVNQKGGVGKTTLTVNLAWEMAHNGGFTVAALDLDPQAQTTLAYGVTPQRGAPGTVSLLRGEPEQTSDSIQALAGYPLVSLIASHIDLAAQEIELERRISRELLLTTRLQAISRRFDVLIMDCAPSLGLLTVNALAAADLVLIPVQTHPLAVDSLAAMLRTIEEVRRAINPSLTFRLVLTMFDKDNAVNREVADYVRKHFPAQTLLTVLPYYGELTKMGYGAGPLRAYAAKNHPGLKMLEMMAGEVLATHTRGGHGID